MYESTKLTPISGDATSNVAPLHSPDVVVQKKEERLPFTISVARGDQRLRKAVFVRREAYARHVPALAESLADAEPYDTERGAVVLLAESKLDGSPLGSIRIHTNRHRSLSLEGVFEFPAFLKGKSMAHASRLGVQQGRVGEVVKTALFKAYYLFCVESKVEWMIIAARSPLDRQYDRLLFDDVRLDTGFVPLASAGNVPHRIMKFEVPSAEARWRAADHKLYDYVFRTNHPDIDLSGLPSAVEIGEVDERHSLRIMGIKA